MGASSVLVQLGPRVGLVDAGVRMDAGDRLPDLAALQVVPAERVYLTTDCGLRNLPRIVARMKLKALADGAGIEAATVMPSVVANSRTAASSP